MLVQTFGHVPMLSFFGVKNFPSSSNHNSFFLIWSYKLASIYLQIFWSKNWWGYGGNCHSKTTCTNTKKLGPQSCFTQETQTDLAIWKCSYDLKTTVPISWSEIYRQSSVK